MRTLSPMATAAALRCMTHAVQYTDEPTSSVQMWETLCAFDCQVNAEQWAAERGIDGRYRVVKLRRGR